MPSGAASVHGQDAQSTTDAQIRDYLTNDECFWPDFRVDPGFKICPPESMKRRAGMSGGWRVFTAPDRVSETGFEFRPIPTLGDVDPFDTPKECGLP